MPRATLFAGLLLASTLPARAQVASTPTPSGIQCDGPDITKREPDWKETDVCPDLEGAAKGAWQNSKCVKNAWNYMVATCRVGKYPLCGEVDVQNARGSNPADKIKAAWTKHAETFDRLFYMKDARDRYLADRLRQAKTLNSYLDAKDACNALKSDSGNVDKLKALQDKKTAFDAAYKAHTDKDADVEDLASPSLRLALTFPDNPAPIKDVRDAVDSWSKSLGDSVAAKAQAAQAAAAAAQAEAAKKEAAFDQTRGQFRDRLGKGDAQAVSEEMRTAFDQAGIKGVKVGDATKGAGGVILMDITISREDFAKLSDAQKAKLQSMGIMPPPPGMKAAPFSFATPDQQKRIDYFEHTLFANDPTLKLRLDATASAVSDAGPRQWAQAALGSSVANLAEDSHGQAALRDKLNAAKSKAAADYATADADAIKKCQDNYAKLIKMGIDPHTADQKCAQDRQNALLDYHGRLSAVTDQQSHADQLSATANTQRLQAYGEVLAAKKSANSNLFGQQGLVSYWSNKGVAFGSEMTAQQNKAKAAYTALFNEINREQGIVAQALAKMPDVQSGSGSMASVRSLDPNFIGKLVESDRTADAYDQIMGDKQAAFEKAMLAR